MITLNANTPARDTADITKNIRKKPIGRGMAPA